MSYTILKTSSVVEPEAYVFDTLAEALQHMDGVRAVMADIPVVHDSPDHLSYRSAYGATWAFTIVERAQLSPYWKNREVAA